MDSTALQKDPTGVVSFLYIALRISLGLFLLVLSVAMGWFIMWKLVLSQIPFVRYETHASVTSRNFAFATTHSMVAYFSGRDFVSGQSKLSGSDGWNRKER